MNASFGRGLPAEEVWTVASRMVFNPNQRSRYIFNVVKGYDQSTGNPVGGTRDYFEFNAKTLLNRRHLVSGYFMKDKWGPYDFYRQFNITYPGSVFPEITPEIMLVRDNYVYLATARNIVKKIYHIVPDAAWGEVEQALAGFPVFVWSGEALKHPPPDDQTAVIQELNRTVANDPRVTAVLVHDS